MAKKEVQTHGQKIKKEFSELMKDSWMKWNLVTIVLFFIAWFLLAPKLGNSENALRTISLVLFSIALFCLARNLDLKDKEPFFRFFQYFVALLFAILAVAHIFVSTGSPVAGAYFLVFAVVLVLLVDIYFYGKQLSEPKSIIDLCIAYIVLSFLAIVIFGAAYEVVNGSAILDKDANEIADQWSFIYFSGSTFYSHSYDDLLPIGRARIIFVIEHIISAVLHVVILAYLITVLANKHGTSKDAQRKV